MANLKHQLLSSVSFPKNFGVKAVDPSKGYLSSSYYQAEYATTLN